jgi:hypothetical protein
VFDARPHDDPCHFFLPQLHPSGCAGLVFERGLHFVLVGSKRSILITA